MLYLLIVGCEISFWVVLLAALLCRYGAGWTRASTVLLLALPAVDLLLFTASTVDLARGAVPTSGHGLAAVYLGVSIAFGGQLVAWADGRIAPRFGGPAPSRPPRAGREHAARERRQWLRHLLAWSIGSCLILLDTAIVHDLHRAAPLIGLIRSWAVILVIDFAWSFSGFLRGAHGVHAREELHPRYGGAECRCSLRCTGGC
ncbi:hypothetical protein [Kitasatospora kifunensis]|uniref:Integral membrane protein n=1 Tax=Kitasatospora kifunensis TaxID=58351 RepID=A0A7W7R9G4_KITKI|nr:hypothetical protein [Kitasatospora kifunensis]MBB4927910.1 hypothetical protein [Kitasatospora kifunensis]